MGILFSIPLPGSAPRKFISVVGINYQNLSPQQVGFLPISHCAQDVVQQQGHGEVETQVELKANEEIAV